MNSKSAVSISHIREPKLEFGYRQKLEYPRDGLYLYGPKTDSGYVPEMRYGVIGTAEGVERFRVWAETVREFVDVPNTIVSTSSPGLQHIPFPGFGEVFGTKWSSKPAEVISDIDSTGLLNALRIGNRYEAIRDAVSMYVDKLVTAQDRLENPPSFWFVVIPEEVYLLGRPQSKLSAGEKIQGKVRVSIERARELEYKLSFFTDEVEEAEVYKYAVHFRRQLKARLLKDRIVTQIVRETTLTPEEFVTESGVPKRKLQDPATVAWNLCTCAYYKAGGKPWQLADVRPGVCYVGLVYKKTKPDDENDRYACCAAQMFLSDGDGIVFRGALGPWYSPYRREYHLDKVNACRLIQMVMREYETIHGKAPAELFVHARSAFSRKEWAGFEMGCATDTSLVGVQILDARSNLKMYRMGKYPVIRGTAMKLTPRNAFLWTSGYIPRLDTYLGPETPNPLQIKITRGSCSLDTVLSDVLGLTKVNFNSCIYNDRLPVTIKFADAVGDVLLSAPMEGEPKLPFKYYI